MISKPIFTAVVFLVICGLTPGQTQTQTARDYYNELKAANSFARYRDEYVCFPDDDAPSFAIMARASDVIEHMKRNGDKAGAETLKQAKDTLFVHRYYKGVGGEEYIFEPVKKGGDDENVDYMIEFGKPKPGKMVYSINWTTGRYVLRVYMYQHSKDLPAADGAGKCELIHPDAKAW